MNAEINKIIETFLSGLQTDQYTTMDMPALERIARELELMNRLKALELKSEMIIPEIVDKIMED